MIEAPHVFFTDDIFWMNVRRAKEMARLIKAAGIKKYFKLQTRTDIICRHPETGRDVEGVRPLINLSRTGKD